MTLFDLISFALVGRSAIYGSIQILGKVSGVFLSFQMVDFETELPDPNNVSHEAWQLMLFVGPGSRG
jgi:hypothetical protein